jgi:hypothetical protein
MNILQAVPNFNQLVKVRVDFASDDENTPSKVVVLPSAQSQAHSISGT